MIGVIFFLVDESRLLLMKCRNCGFMKRLDEEFGYCTLERKIVRINEDMCSRRSPTISVMNTCNFSYWSGKVLVLECQDCGKQYYSNLRLKKCFACKGRLEVVGERILRITVGVID